MSGLTKAQIQTNLDAANTAYQKALARQSYSITAGEDSRSLNYQSISDLQDAVRYWEKRLRRAEKGGIVVRGATPVTD